MKDYLTKEDIKKLSLLVTMPYCDGIELYHKHMYHIKMYGAGGVPPFNSLRDKEGNLTNIADFEGGSLGEVIELAYNEFKEYLK